MFNNSSGAEGVRKAAYNVFDVPTVDPTVSNLLRKWNLPKLRSLFAGTQPKFKHIL